jgi:hypothetical protein
MFIFPDFSLESFLVKNDLSTQIQKLPSEIALVLLNRFGLSSFLLESQCDRQTSPYIPTIDGWTNGKCVTLNYRGAVVVGFCPLGGVLDTTLCDKVCQ